MAAERVTQKLASGISTDQYVPHAPGDGAPYGQLALQFGKRGIPILGQDMQTLRAVDLRPEITMRPMVLLDDIIDLPSAPIESGEGTPDESVAQTSTSLLPDARAALRSAYSSLLTAMQTENKGKSRLEIVADMVHNNFRIAPVAGEHSISEIINRNQIGLGQPHAGEAHLGVFVKEGYGDQRDVALLTYYLCIKLQQEGLLSGDISIDRRENTGGQTMSWVRYTSKGITYIVDPTALEVDKRVRQLKRMSDADFKLYARPEDYDAARGLTTPLPPQVPTFQSGRGDDTIPFSPQPQSDQTAKRPPSSPQK